MAKYPVNVATNISHAVGRSVPRIFSRWRDDSAGGGFAVTARFNAMFSLTRRATGGDFSYVTLSTFFRFKEIPRPARYFRFHRFYRIYCGESAIAHRKVQEREREREKEYKRGRKRDGRRKRERANVHTCNAICSRAPGH